VSQFTRLLPRMSKLFGAAALLAAAAPALASDTLLSPGQLEAAARVFTGDVDCEHKQKIKLEPIPGTPGHFKLTHKKATYTLVPHETTTGAVRLEDRKNGIVWLQIPAKSMLMNAKIGQRMVDSCQHAEQQAAAAPTEGSIGIAAAAPPN
jgi:hypothetical protein